MGWLVFSGDDGIDAIFDADKNPSKRHRRDEALVPFNTKNDKKRYEDFSGVVGVFSRLMSDTVVKGGVDVETFHDEIRKKVEDSSEDDYNTLFRIIDDLYFKNGKLLPSNVKSLSYIDFNNTQKRVAEYIYSVFVDGTDLKEKYGLMEENEDTNVLENLVFSSLTDADKTDYGSLQKADCFLPYVKEVFIKDFAVLMSNNDRYKTYINRFLAYYYMYYVSQLAVKLKKFDQGHRDEIEKVYLTLNWEVVTRVRPGYEYGWKLVKEAISHMFSHAVVLEMMSHNEENLHLDYIGIKERMMETDDDSQTSEDVLKICDKYKEWIPIDYERCKHDSQKDGSCETSNAIRRLFEIVDFQFLNGGRVSHYNGFNKKFIDFVQKNFGKWRGALGYSIGVNENDIVMFTHVIIEEHGGKVRLSKLFNEFERRGLLFDRESKKQITELFEKMNLLEKRSDSGDAQYVKSVL